MNKKEYFEYHKQFTDEMTIITQKKNADYTGATDDPFANFTQVEKSGICSTEQGFLTRMSDKMSRINSFVQKGFLEVKDESVKDTLQDLANYAILMSAYIVSKKEGKSCKASSGTDYLSPEEEDAWDDISKRNYIKHGGILG